MLLKNRFKPYSKINSFYAIIPRNRVFNFKRPKWRKIKRQARRSFNWLKRSFTFKGKMKRFFFNRRKHLRKKEKSRCRFKPYKPTIILFPSRTPSIRWLNKKDTRALKYSIFLMFSFKFPPSFYKKILKQNITRKLNLVIEVLLKPFFYLDIIIWKVGFFKTFFQTRQTFFNRTVLVNNKLSENNNYFLRKNDIITVNAVRDHVVSHTPFLLPDLFEIDFYSRTIIVIKNYQQIDKHSLRFLYKKEFRLDNFLEYMKKIS